MSVLVKQLGRTIVWVGGTVWREVGRGERGEREIIPAPQLFFVCGNITL